jgi:hypothetical protein
MIVRKLKRTIDVRHRRKALFSLLLLMASFAAAQRAENSSPGELIQATVAKELAASDAPGHYMYRLTKDTPEYSQTKEMIETRDWLIGRLISVNHQPLRPEQQQKEDRRLRELLTDPSALRALQKREHRDEERVRGMMRALPDAFIYEYAGTERQACCGELIRLKFRPNPKFDPPSLASRVYQGMEGTMLVDPTVRRLVRVDAELVRDVEFGWGFFGRLYRGGTFFLEQRDVGSGRWAMTTLALHFTGRILLFKKINIDSVRKASDFRRMPDNLTLEQGLALLLKEAEMVKESTVPKPRENIIRTTSTGLPFSSESIKSLQYFSGRR